MELSLVAHPTPDYHSGVAHWRLSSRGAVLGAVLLTAGACSAPPSTTTSSSPAPPLWGDMKPVVSVKELMRDMIDPIADNIFEAVSTVIDKNGTVETEPRTEADWDRIRMGAVTLAEGAYLLKIPRPFAPAGDDNDSGGPEPLELSPAQIKAKLEKDPVLWNAKIEALRNVGLEVLEIVKKKDTKQLWAAAEDLDEACETCHLIYWYPGQPALLEKLDKKLEEMHGPRGTLKLGMDPRRTTP